MPPSSSTQPLVVKAPAKLNLFLEVLGRRPDGYHEIVTVMQTVDLFDELVFEKQSRELTLICRGDEVPCDESNLVLRAAHMLREGARRDLGARITLTKRIPIGAGMGGGSSDAAATIKGLNLLWELDLSDSDQHALAGRLGSDVNFFLVGGTALCRGRGERVESIAGVPIRHYVVVYPNVQLRTRDVYEKASSALTTSCQDTKLFVTGTLCTEGPGAGGWFNRLQRAAFDLWEGLSEVKETMQAVGLEGVTMTGSGSALFGIAADRDAAQTAAQRLRDAGCGRVFVTQSLA